mgnify:CR=1 FL=1
MNESSYVSQHFYILSFVEHVILRKKGVFDLIDLFFLKGQ